MPLSYACGPEFTLLETTIPQTLAQTAERFPERDALIVRHQNLRYCWRELENEVERVAQGLAGLGLKPGARIGIWASNCAEWVLLQLATARAAMILVNVNPAYRAHELAFVLRKSGMDALFLRERDARANYRSILEASGSRPQHVVYLGTSDWDNMLEQGSPAVAEPASNNDVVNIQYTSGTTGSPKGVLLSHRNLLNNALLVARNVKYTEHDRIISPLPLYHCGGCVLGVLVALVSGAALILPSSQFDAQAALQAVEAERATGIHGVPTMFIAELDHPEFSKFNLSSLRTGFMGGAPCPIEVMRKIATDMHCREMTIVYGQTEASPVITMSACDDSLENRVSTVGRALPATEVKIVSAKGETVQAGEQGELCTRGYLVMSAYDQEPEATSAAIDSEGWLHTGDLAVMSPDSYFHITGRSRDLIIRGGENIYPREIEEYLFTHPKIVEAQVVGLPDEKLGEVVLAWIRLKTGQTATEEEIQEFCTGSIAHFKIPQYIRFVDSFPMTVTGKVQKFVIRQQEIEARGLNKAAQINMA
jgi:fatty-acyl-CoA synthase